MKKNLIILAIIIVVFLGGLYLGRNRGNLGYSYQPISYTGATNSSSSIPTTATTTNPILSFDAGRTFARVCNNSAYTVFLHPKTTNVVTGVAVNTGIPLSPVGLSTSTANVCQDFPGFTGYLFGISETAATVTVSSY